MRFDFKLLFFILLLLLLGLYNFYGIYKVLVAKSPEVYKYLFLKYLLGNIFLPITLFLLSASFKWNFIKRITLPLFVIFLIFTLLPFIPELRLPGQNNARWFYFKGFSFQPTEFLKIFTLLLIAFLMPLIKRHRDYLLITLAIVVAIGIIIFKQPALSNLIIFISGIIGGFLGSKFSFRNLLVISVIIVFIFTLGLTQEYRVKRILGILTNEEAISFQLKQSRSAIASGGLFGKGLGKSEFKLIGIPLITTDSIFAIYSEETGFIGALILIALYLFLVYLIFKKASLIKNEEKKFFAYGFGTMLSSQVFIHIIANIIITTGVPLPFFSYGPSNMISLMIGFGIINSLEYS